ncbi:MAG: hypothetical protein KDI71_24040, partial [Xanthomonadales bacterium]|nr:hypothetical protein [Xanthomonadales bacterium]
MNTRPQPQWRLRLLPAMLLAALPFAAAQAQEDEARQLDRVEVTGSRIKSAAIQGQTPVQVISREDIQR